jgi:hypothetical protein
MPPPCPHHAAHLAHLTLLDLTTQPPLGEEHKSWNPSLCDRLQPHYFISLMPTYLPQCHILKHPQPMFLPVCERDKVSCPYKIMEHRLCFNLCTFG